MATLDDVPTRDDESEPLQAHEDPELLALLKYAVVSGLIGVVLWHLGTTDRGSVLPVVFKIGGGLCFLVTAWSGVWMVMLAALVVVHKLRGRH